MPAKFSLIPTQIEQTKLFFFTIYTNPIAFCHLVSAQALQPRGRVWSHPYIWIVPCAECNYMYVYACTHNPYKNLWLQYACCVCAAVRAAHMQVAHMCCIWAHACSLWAGRHKLVLCAPRFSAYVQHTSAGMWICVTWMQHTSACMWICVTWMQHARIWPKDASSMCAAFCKGCILYIWKFLCYLQKIFCGRKGSLYSRLPGS